MNASDPTFLFLGLVLPCLFAITLIGEGMWKLSQKMSGWVSVAFGLGVIVLTLWVYFFVLPFDSL